MPEQITQQTNIGKTLVEWAIQEYEQHERPMAWYVIMTIVGLFFVTFGLFTGNFLFSFIIILFGIILYIQSHQDPPTLSFLITSSGIVVGTKFYPYAELESFYIIYSPPRVQTLFIQTKSPFRPQLRIPLPEINPLDIRSVLLQYMYEDMEQEEEPYADQIAREWQLH